MKFLKKISNKAKIILSVVMSIITFIFFLLFKNKLNAKNKLNYELEKVKIQTNLTNLKDIENKKEAEISLLKNKEIEIRNKIEELDNRKLIGEEVSVEEIDEFFRSRGLL